MNSVRYAFLLAAAFAFASAAHAAEPAKRIVSIGGDVTEIVYALGQEGRLVGVDQSALYPEAAAKLPQVGYMRTLAAEGILSLSPGLVIASAQSGPAAVLAQIEDANIPLVRVSGEESFEGALAKVDAIGNALGVPEHANALKAQMSARMAEVNAALENVSVHPKAIFVLAQGQGGALASGRGTAADAMFALAKAENAAAGFEGYKPLTPESAMALAPDVVVIATHAVDMLGGLDAFRARPEIVSTPAAKNNRIVVMDSLLLLGFGPRTPEGVAQLAMALHPGLVIPVTTQ